MIESKSQRVISKPSSKSSVVNPFVHSSSPSKAWNLSHLDVPAFLMCPPLSYNTSQPNNIWMDDLDEMDRKVDDKKAARQFQALYQFLSSRGIVQL